MWPIIIAAAAGAAAGGFSIFGRSQKEKQQLEQQKQAAQAAYRYQLAYNEGMWNLQRTQNLENLNIQNNRLAQAFKMDISGFNLGLEGQALQNQAAQISLADSKGMALAQQGMSGVKGSDTLQKRIDFQEGMFDRQLDLQGRGNSLSMQGMTQQYSNQFNDIGREIESWSPGGYRYQAKSLGDVYAAQMQDLREQGYNQAIQNATPTALDYLTGILGGAGSGASFGSQVGKMVDQMPSNVQTPAQSPTLSFSTAYPQGYAPGYSLLWNNSTSQYYPQAQGQLFQPSLSPLIMTGPGAQ